MVIYFPQVPQVYTEPVAGRERMLYVTISILSPLLIPPHFFDKLSVNRREDDKNQKINQLNITPADFIYLYCDNLRYYFITEIPLKSLGTTGMYLLEVIDQQRKTIQSNKIVLE